MTLAPAPPPSQPPTGSPAQPPPGSPARSAAPLDPAVDPNDPGFIADPYPAYAALRARDPVHWSALLDGWVVTRYDDVVAILKDGRRFSSARSQALARGLEGAPVARVARLFDHLATWLLMRDGPDHARRRAELKQGFMPRVVRGMLPLIDAHVAALVDALADRDRADAVAEFAHPLPVHLISGMLRVPRADYGRVLAWSDDIAAVLGAKPLPAALAETGQDSFVAVAEYFRGIIADARRDPGEDFLSALLAADRDRCMTDDELCVQLGMLLFSGHDTTRHLIGNTLHQLFRHPEALARVRARPALLAAAIEETLRYDPPIQFSMRIAVEDVDVRGRAVRAGQAVYAFAAAAHRDPAEFPDPDRFDIDRGAPRHVAFGAGPHFCIGFELARLQARAAVGGLLRRFPDLGPDPGLPPERTPVFGFRGFRTLPVALRPPPSPASPRSPALEQPR